MSTDAPKCPYCGIPMKKWRTPQMPFAGGSTWASEFLYVCFNDECSYFVNGWDWMWNNYHQHLSYRHVLDPATGIPSPVAVPSYDSMKDMIIDESFGR